MKYLISSCLMGENCKYSGGNNKCEELVSFMKDKDFICVCPEVLGGLPIPRACAEIKGGRIINTDHEDVTEEFKKGAKLALDIALEAQVDLAILQPRSPSCGKGKRYSGNFDGTLIEGNGVFCDLLEKNQIPVMNVEEFQKKMWEKETS